MLAKEMGMVRQVGQMKMMRAEEHSDAEDDDGVVDGPRIEAFTALSQHPGE